MCNDEMMALLYELFDPSLPRLAPGDDRSTVDALRMLLSEGSNTYPEQLKVLDIGCGNGAQTIALAGEIDGSILAVDNHQSFLVELQRRAEAKGVSDRVRTLERDMCDLHLPAESFDLIWSEGALYIMGFAKGLAACRDLLLPHGMLAASELCWLQPDPPTECNEFFDNEYPAMTDVETNWSAARRVGLTPIGHLTLSESAWSNYFNPLERRLRSIRERHVDNPRWCELIASVEKEIEMYDKHSAYYGYVFFLMRRN
ncbi:MAG: methyltransferase type 11 [Phycisphaerae bacterium]|nr:MAG: methyltransferase type 11 [Phycisphaerae bacterium]